MNSALPGVRAWIASAVAEYRPRATPVAALGFERLPLYFPEDVLQHTRALTVTRIPFPPIGAIDVPALTGLQQMADYLRAYAVGLVQHGYARSPLEIMAFDLQSQFDRGRDIASVVDTIQAHALETRAVTDDYFRINS